jgi:hypothetical protein
MIGPLERQEELRLPLELPRPDDRARRGPDAADPEATPSRHRVEIDLNDDDGVRAPGVIEIEL